MISAPRAIPFRAWPPRLASLRITVLCLVLLLVLTAWGTVYQASHGLYAAQEMFFHSWFFLAGGIVPFPGAQLVLWILFMNLLASMIFRVKYSLGNLGNIVTHGGLLFLLAGSFITYHFSQESYLPLAEKEESNVSLDRRNWELALWMDGGKDLEKTVSAVKLGPGEIGESFDFPEFGVKAVLENYYRNCVPGSPAEGANPGLGTEGSDPVGKLVPQRPAQDPQDNLPGAVLRLRKNDGTSETITLYGGQDQPLSVPTEKGNLQVTLRAQRHPLPMTLRLLDVRKKDYPGTAIAKSYESDVEVQSDGARFQTRIYMNHPLHYHGFIFYQASYGSNAQGRESSTFAVVENRGRLVPYLSGGLIFTGMALHFILMLFGYGHRHGNTEENRRNGTTTQTASANTEVGK